MCIYYTKPISYVTDALPGIRIASHRVAFGAVGGPTAT